MTQMNFHETFTTLQHHGAALLTNQERGLRRLPIVDLHLLPDVFQPRQNIEETAAHGAHVAELVRAVRASRGKGLKPIVVLKVCALGWVIIDGHHRYEAYQQAGGRRTHCPVTVFTGTIVEALRFAIAENSPDKLNLSLADKREAAWRLVLLGTYTQAAISEAAGVSESTVDRMRAALAKVKADHPAVSWESQSWVRVKWYMRGEGKGNPMWKDQRAQQVAAKLTKHFQGLAKDQPDTFVKGLALHVPDMIEQIGRLLLTRAAIQRADGDF